VSLFKKAGVALPKGDRVTWEEWMAAAAKVKKATGVPFAAAVDRSGHRLAGFLQSYKGGFFTADGKDVRITSPETTKGVEASRRFPQGRERCAHGHLGRRHRLRRRQPAV
jgi:ABC-type glycerol-3-phosphate transport system substrate-binding protein